jgi:hypothetical protein
MSGDVRETEASCWCDMRSLVYETRHAEGGVSGRYDKATPCQRARADVPESERRVAHFSAESVP